MTQAVNAATDSGYEDSSKTVKVTIKLERGEGIGGDDNGVSSYIKFLIDGKELGKSHTMKKTSNPTWTENFELETNSMEHPITIQAYDSGMIKV